MPPSGYSEAFLPQAGKNYSPIYAKSVSKDSQLTYPKA